MATTFVFADEAGDFTFKTKRGASKYFILCTVAGAAWTVSDQLLSIRRELAINGDPSRDKLHATSDLQEVRNRVFEVIQKQDFRIDATIIEKRKAMPRIRETQHQFYQYAWFYHFKHVGPKVARNASKLLITAAALGERKTQAAFKECVNNTVQQTLSRDRWEVACHESAKEPLLWVADYCAWAIMRKWEQGDRRSYSLIQKKIATEFDLFESGRQYYYD